MLWLGAPCCSSLLLGLLPLPWLQELMNLSSVPPDPLCWGWAADPEVEVWPAGAWALLAASGRLLPSGPQFSGL